jgi:Mor family transcriptional regulator
MSDAKRVDGTDEEQLDLVGYDQDAILNNLDMVTNMDECHWPQRLVELIDITSSYLKREHRIEKDQAHIMARGISAAIGSYFGGQQLYIPTGKALELAVRDHAIWEDFTGNNIGELVIKYKLTCAQIYNIIAKQRQLNIAKRQHSLFT